MINGNSHDIVAMLKCGENC